MVTLAQKARYGTNTTTYFGGFEVVDFLLLILKGGSKVQILGQGGAIKQPPMDEMTSNFACRGVLWGTFEFWPS